MKNNWNRLDNAAKIFPSASRKTDTQVFRLSCELYEAVIPEILQQALNETLEVFKVYQCILKRGIFWYYLESSDLMPIVREEYKYPCQPIYNKNIKTLLFEVTYYNTRINLEVFHVLTDGTGAMHFLRQLLTKYLALVNGLKEPVLDYDASRIQMSDDSFLKYYNDSIKVKKAKKTSACVLKGFQYTEDRLKIIAGLTSVKELLDAAHRYNTTLTVFLCACFMNAISESVPVRAKKKPIILSVPVNLRKYFPSESARNFFSVVYVGYDYWRSSGELEDVIKSIDEDFKRQLSKENLANIINSFANVEHNIFARIAPLFFKDFVLKRAYSLSKRWNTAAVSNIGVIKMPEELKPYINAFYLSAATLKVQLCLCSYEDKLSISFTAPFLSTDIQRRFFRKLTDMGIGVEVTTNLMDDED